jgi:hypothetical protein
MAGHVSGTDISRTEEGNLQDCPGESVVTYVPRISMAMEEWLAGKPLSLWWAVGGFSLALLLLPVILAQLDGLDMRRLLADYRAQFIYPFMIAYLVAASRFVQRTRESVARALRPLVQLDESTFAQLVKHRCRVDPKSELIGFGVGAGLGLAINIAFEPVEPTHPVLLAHYAYLSRIILWAVSGWAVSMALATTRLTNTLLRQPILVEIFDPMPFQPIGRQSLLLSLVLIGGMLLSLLTTNFARQELRLEYLVVYPVIVALSVAIFLLNTYGVHRLLAAIKRQKLEAVGRHLARACNRLEELISEDQDTHAVATELNALATIKRELQRITTWPYNMEMLRTILISAAAPPLFTVIGRLAAQILSAGPLP